MGTGNFDLGTPLRYEGDIDVRLDGDGRLRSLAAMPVRKAARSSAPNWLDIFLEAGLDPLMWTSVSPTERPRFFVDTRAAWEGTLAAGPDVGARIEATALEGRMALQTSAWYSSAGYAALGIVGATAVYGFKTALAGRPILTTSALAD